MIVIARSYGQLGNRLILYSHFIAAAREYGVDLANPCFSEYAHLFPTTFSDRWCRFPLRATESQRRPSLLQRQVLSKAVYLSGKTLWLLRLRHYPFHVIRLRGEEACDLGGDEFARMVRSGRPVLASGWAFRSERLLQKHATAVRDHFHIAEPHRSTVDRLLAKLRQESDVVVGVHIRHGDYANFMNGRYYYSTQQYADMMQRVADQLPGQRVSFLVCGNSPLQTTDFPGLHVTLGPGHIIEDMYALAETDLMMGPPSTYTGWASFYGNTPLSYMQSASHTFDVKTLMQSRAASAA